MTLREVFLLGILLRNLYGFVKEGTCGGSKTKVETSSDCLRVSHGFWLVKGESVSSLKVLSVDCRS